MTVRPDSAWSEASARSSQGRRASGSLVPGRMVARSEAGSDICRAVRGRTDRAGAARRVARSSRWRTAARTGRCRCRKARLMAARMRCCYHGWRYDASGACVDVPYLGKGKLPNGVRRYPCFERDGLIFVWPGTCPAAEPLARIGAAADAAYKTRRFGEQVDCHYTFMHENLMDMNHQFLHRRTTGKVVPRYLGSRAGERWMEVDYSFARPGEKPPIGEAVIVGGLRGRAQAARDLMTVRTEYPYQSLRMWTRGDEPVLSVWLGYTPVDAAQRVTGPSWCCRCASQKFPACSTWPGRCWPGSPTGSSRRIARSSRWSRLRMTRRAAPTGIRKSFHRSARCENCCSNAASRLLPPRTIP